jgi:hypothetical protein
MKDKTFNIFALIVVSLFLLFMSFQAGRFYEVFGTKKDFHKIDSVCDDLSKGRQFNFNCGDKAYKLYRARGSKNRWYYACDCEENK